MRHFGSVLVEHHPEDVDGGGLLPAFRLDECQRPRVDVEQRAHERAPVRRVAGQGGRTKRDVGGGER